MAGITRAYRKLPATLRRGRPAAAAIGWAFAPQGRAQTTPPPPADTAAETNRASHTEPLCVCVSISIHCVCVYHTGCCDILLQSPRGRGGAQARGGATRYVRRAGAWRGGWEADGRPCRPAGGRTQTRQTTAAATSAPPGQGGGGEAWGRDALCAARRSTEGGVGAMGRCGGASPAALWPAGRRSATNRLDYVKAHGFNIIVPSIGFARWPCAWGFGDGCVVS